MPKVYNAREGNIPESAVWIDRRSRFGNKFVMGDWWPERNKYMTRADVCDRFEAEQLPSMNVQELRGKDLICWCAPLRCHGDAILRKANKRTWRIR